MTDGNRMGKMGEIERYIQRQVAILADGINAFLEKNMGNVALPESMAARFIIAAGIAKKQRG